MKIFIVEDDKKLKNELITFLSNYGYECDSSEEYKDMVDIILNSHLDLVLLDINLPYFDGYHICREIRKTSDVPIIVVTSRAGDMDELMSMNLGADDFITKPYNTQILLAHIEAVLKRSETKPTQKKICHNGVVLQTARGIATYENNEIELTKNEMKILSVLIENAGRIVTRDELMDELWQSDEFVDDNTLTVNVNRLRRKLEDIGANNYIVTKRGQGYLI
ncbi:response regulator transcription factor [Anaerovorax sp. IOR16]|uniref:response regulator transcription factor n=1 Tax=Anaerovorax sp. IOR16 TaxID=2773458 RepID=UPI0019D01E37|nr:response regulator transcription factor [Anaerovorax sp. IOR16]